MPDFAFSGDSLLVRPVFSAGETQVTVYFPGKDSVWYDIDTHEVYRQGHATVAVDLSKVRFSIK